MSFFQLLDPGQFHWCKLVMSRKDSLVDQMVLLSVSCRERTYFSMFQCHGVMFMESSSMDPLTVIDTRKEHPCVQETYNREHGATPKSIEWVRALRKHQGPRRPVNQSKYKQS